MSPSLSTRLLLTQSDGRLAKLAGEGHERAFEALVHRYRRPLLAYCRRLLLPDERAEDALQQGLLQAWLALQGGAEVREARPWLYKIVHNTALNMLRVSGYDYAKLSETLQGASAPEDDLDRRIAVRDALAGLAALPPMQREALLRTAVDGHSHEQVAHAMGLSEGALRGLVYRARATLRAAATALTPPPALGWALGHRGLASSPLMPRLAEAGAGGSSLGVGSLLLKGGAVVISAGALAGGVAITHRHAVRVPQPLTVPPADAASAPATFPGAPAQGASSASRRRDGLGRNDSLAKRGRTSSDESHGRSRLVRGHALPVLHGGFAEPGDGQSRDRGNDVSQGQSPDSRSSSGQHESSGSTSKDGAGPASGEDTQDGEDLAVFGSGGSGSDTSGGSGSDGGSGGSSDGSSSGSGGGETSPAEAASGSGESSKTDGSQLQGSSGSGLLYEQSSGKDGSSTTPQTDG